MTKINLVAVQAMTHLCVCPIHGYDQIKRWGDGSGYCKFKTDAGEKSVARGDRDCASAVIDAWRQALKGTKYEGKLEAATFTGNMRQAFVASGLFEVKPMTFVAQPGDIYLRDVTGGHTAMCITAVPDMLGEFSENEKKGISGGKVGDQLNDTKNGESHIVAYYEAWDCILHYNGKADTGTKAKAMQGVDVSVYQQGIDFSKVKADFVVVKATQGKSYVSPAFPAQIASAKKAGCLIGVYHYADGSGAKAEAAHFAKAIKAVSGVMGNSLIAIDWENEQNAAWGDLEYLKSLCTETERLTGCKVAIYGASWLGVWDWAKSKGYGKWVAEYAGMETSWGYQDTPWNEGAYDCDIRQYSGTGRLDGFSGQIDLNKCYRDKAWWQKMAGKKDAKPADSASTASGWKQVGSGWQYLKAGKPLKSQWVKDCGYWYYLNADGTMAKGWLKDKGYTYYLRPAKDGKYPEGSMVTGYQSIDGCMHYFRTASEGKMPEGSMV